VIAVPARPIAAQSRLDRMIARLLTQRAALAAAATAVDGLPGVVLELGFGKGRTYSHLCTLLPGRTIFTFDRGLFAPPEAAPAAPPMIVGELEATLPPNPADFGGPVALIHADIGTGDPGADIPLAAFVGRRAAALLAPGGVLLGDRPMAAPGLVSLAPPAPALPAGVSPWPYFLYRAAQ